MGGLMLKPGDKAPDFTLSSDKGESISLVDFLGKSNVVLYFYPKDNTSGCTTEACSFRDTLPKITTKDTVVFGVSPDSAKSHVNFIQKYQLNFTLLSDPEHTVAEAYGAWGEKKMYGKAYLGILRTTFIIGKDGIIKHVFEKVNVEEHANEVLAQLSI
jgi:peroxiredoxin Q/BCP